MSRLNELAGRLPSRTDLHLARKIWHMGMGLMIAFVYNTGMSVRTGVSILGFFLIWDVALETARLRIPSLNQRIMKLWGPIMRSSELNKMSAIPHYILASLIAIAIFPRPVAIMSVLCLACGDPIASLFGILYGDRSHRFANGKSVIGTLAGICACAIVSFLYLKSQQMNDSAVLVLSVVGGLAGGTAELLPFEIDDNFTIPLITGFALWLSYITLGL